MPNELEATRNRQSSALSSALANAASIITKNYLGRLEAFEIMDPSEEDIDIDIAECGSFYRLTKLVMNREETFPNKLTTIVNVASSIDCSIATIIKSDGLKTDYYFGILSKKARERKEAAVRRRRANAAAFHGALQGNLIGSELKELTAEQIEEFRRSTLAKKDNCYASVSGVVSLRDEEDKSIEGYVQGIENLVDSLRGHGVVDGRPHTAHAAVALQVHKARGCGLLHKLPVQLLVAGDKGDIHDRAAVLFSAALEQPGAVQEIIENLSLFHVPGLHGLKPANVILNPFQHQLADVDGPARGCVVH